MKKWDNFCRNLQVLATAGDKDLSDEFIVNGIIDKFNIQFELSWKVLKELLRYEGRAVAASGSPREILKEANVVYDFIDEEAWLPMLQDRNDISHIYDGAAAKRLARKIIEEYIPVFLSLRESLMSRYGDFLTQ